MRFILLLLILGGMFFLPGCYYDKYDELYPSISGGCDTTGSVTYTSDVKPVFEAYCTSCHSGIGAPKGYDFTDYNSSKAAAPRLVGAVNHLSGYTPMPDATTMIDECSRLKIEKWVNTGTPE